MRRILSILVLTTGIISAAQAQVDPLYAQYLNNPLLINPAYSGLNNNLNASISYRKQWAGFDGSPTTVNISAHSAFLNNKMGVGMFIVQDKAAINKNTEVQATYAYRLNLGDQYLSFGLQGGLINYRNNNDDLNPKDPTAPEFSEVQTITKPTIGSGFILSSERYFFGFSVPRMLAPSVSFASGSEAQLYRQHFYFTAAYVMLLSERVRLKPSLMFKGVKGAPVSTDVNVAINLDERYTAGIYTRNLHAYGLLAQLKLSDKYRFGYAFEMPTNNSVGTRFTSHELTLGINLAVLSSHSTFITNF
jgi:type IX secretion system PorP/SprF family membrane protein